MKLIWACVWESEKRRFWLSFIVPLLWLGGLLLGIVLFAAVSLSGILNSFPENLATPLKTLIAGVIQHGTGLAVSLACIRFLYKKRLRNVFTDGRPFDVTLAVQSALLWTLLWFTGIAVVPGGWELIAGRVHETSLSWWITSIPATLLAITLQATDEEVVFRGYLIPRLTAWAGSPLVAVAISTTLFTALHRNAAPAAVVAIVLLGIAFSIAAIRTGSLAPGIGMHAAHNTLSLLWFPKSTNADANWPCILIIAFQLVIWVGWILWATRSSQNPVIATGPVNK